MRFGDQLKGGAKQEGQGVRAIFTEFTDPATKTGAGVHIKNLYNDYIYFWRWALWRLFEQQKCGGLSPSSPLPVTLPGRVLSCSRVYAEDLR